MCTYPMGEMCFVRFFSNASCWQDMGDGVPLTQLQECKLEIFLENTWVIYIVCL